MFRMLQQFFPTISLVNPLKGIFRQPVAKRLVARSSSTPGQGGLDRWARRGAGCAIGDHVHDPPIRVESTQRRAAKASKSTTLTFSIPIPLGSMAPQTSLPRRNPGADDCLLRPKTELFDDPAV
jgi:hypothetical protein